METSQKLDAKQELMHQFDMYAHLFNVDLDALNEANATKSYGGCTRSAVDVMGECAGFNKLITSIITGDESASYESVKEVEALATNKETAKAVFASSLDEIKAAIAGMSEDQLAEQVMAPWGQPMSRYGLAAIAAAHAWYHNGQVAYMQGLNNDPKNYWMPE